MAHLGPLVKAAPGDGHKGDAGPLQRVLVERKGGRSAKEQRHVPPGDALLLAQFVEPAGQRLGSSLASLVGGFAQTEVELDEGRGEARARLLTVGVQRGKGDLVGPLGVLFGAQDRGQQVVEHLDQRRVGAKGGVQVDLAAPGGDDVGLDLAKDGHVGAAKAVDGLFGVADDKQSPATCRFP